MTDHHSSLHSSKFALAELRLLHLADSAFPIGSLAHSFGLESLVDSERLTVEGLPEFFRAYLEEPATLEAIFARAAFLLAQNTAADFPEGRWLELNDRLGALKPGRESRAGSAVLGENLLNAVLAIEDLPVVHRALESAREIERTGRGGFQTRSLHHSLAFGLAAGALRLDPDRAALAYLHQSLANLVSACQRLMPLGQSAATRILWNLKPAMIEAAARSAEYRVEDARSFTPLLDWAAMEHPALMTRLFIS
jgi:urease accessory protein